VLSFLKIQQFDISWFVKNNCWVFSKYSSLTFHDLLRMTYLRGQSLIWAIVLYVHSLSHQLFLMVSGRGQQPQKVPKGFTVFSNLQYFSAGSTPEMSELSYFTIQIHFWIFETLSKSKHSPNIFLNVRSKIKYKSKRWEKCSFFNKKCCNYFPYTKFKYGLHPKFLKRFTIGIQSKSNKIRHTPPSGSSQIQVQA